MTREGKTRERLISADGLRCGDEKPRESSALAAEAGAGEPNSYSEVGPKPEEGHSVRAEPSASGPKTAWRMLTAWRESLNPCKTRPEGRLREAGKPQERSASVQRCARPRSSVTDIL
jgi:hypothetical protein